MIHLYKESLLCIIVETVNYSELSKELIKTLQICLFMNNTFDFEVFKVQPIE